MDRDWRYLPVIVLEDILHLLAWRDRLNCACVCQNWYTAFFSPRLWRRLEVNERTFTYLRPNHQYKYEDYSRKLSSFRAQGCLSRVGSHIRTIVISEKKSFHDLYSFLTVLNSFLTYYDEYPMPQLERLEFTFPCETIDLWSHEPVIIGTGGQILQALKALLGNLKGLKALVFNHLLIEAKDTPGFMDNFLPHNRNSIHYLHIRNFTKYRCPLFYAGMFPNLEELVLSPTQLTDTVVVMVAEQTRCRLISIVQDRYTPPSLEPVSSHAWFSAHQSSPGLRVRLSVTGRTDADILLQPGAPVSQVIYSSCQSKVDPQTVMQISEGYKHTLLKYGHMCTHRRKDKHSFYERADTILVLLVRECRYLTTIAITERVSTCTLLVIAHEAKNLSEFLVRRNAIILRYDWPRASNWTEEFLCWLKLASRSYDFMEKEIGIILKQPNWHLLSDQQFLSINL